MRRVLTIFRSAFFGEPPRLPAILFCSLALASMQMQGASVRIPEVRSYQTGEIADADIVTPVPIVITEYEAPRRTGPERQPLVYVLDVNAATETEAKLRSMVAGLRDEFLDKLVVACKYRQLTPQQAQHPGFAKFVAWFQNQHKTVPLTSELAETWATGEEDGSLVNPWREALAETMKLPLVASLPDPALQVHLISSEDRKKLGWNNLAECLGAPVTGLEFRTLNQAKRQLMRKFPTDANAAEFIAQFIRENCVADQSLSSLAAWAQKPPGEATDASQHSYAPGQTIVRRGQVIDAPAKAAIDVLRAKREEARSEALQAMTERFVGISHKTQGFLAAFGAWSKSLWEHDSMLVMLVGGAFVLLAGGSAIMRGRRLRRQHRFATKETAYTVVFNPVRKETVFLPLDQEARRRLTGPSLHTLGGDSGHPSDTPKRSPPSLYVPLEAEPRDGPSSVDSKDEPSPNIVTIDWEARVRDTEERAHELLERVREGLAPHLAREMMNELVRKLICDRSGLLQAQQIATREIEAIEKRFAKIHAELQERLWQYQVRNSLLEQQLANRTEENQELIRTQIEALQKKLQ